MATIQGPKVEMPSVQTPMFTIGPDGQNTALAFAWGTYLNALHQISFNSTRSGPTASRPTSDVPGRWVGMPYFDTDLGLYINLKSVNPDVWVRYDGTPV